MTEPTTARPATTQTKPQRAMTGAGYGGTAGAAAIVLAWVSREFWGVEMPAEIVAALAVLITWAAERLGGYLSR